MNVGVRLSLAERKLLSLVASGLHDDEIASLLGQTEQDVIASVDRLLVKTKSHDRFALALIGLAETGTPVSAANDFSVVERILPASSLSEAGMPRPGRSYGIFDLVDGLLLATIVGIVATAMHFWKAPGRFVADPVERTAERVEAADKGEPGSRPSALPGQAGEANREDGPAVPLRIVPASYTDEARYANFHGKIFVVVIVNEYGRVDRVEYSAPVPFHLDQGPIPEATRQWLFRPARRDGKPVPSRVVMEVPFR